jgi:hypothetical protein
LFGREHSGFGKFSACLGYGRDLAGGGGEPGEGNYPQGKFPLQKKPFFPLRFFFKKGFDFPGKYWQTGFEHTPDNII